MKAGFIAVVGKPKVGKSTLINKLVHEKLAIVSDKAEMTKDSIKGTLNMNGNQYIFIETPGIHKPKKMTNVAIKSLREVEAIVFLLDGSQEISTSDQLVMDRIKEVGDTPRILVINKIDKFTDEQMEVKRAEIPEKLGTFDEIVELSAKHSLGLSRLLKALGPFMEEGMQFSKTELMLNQDILSNEINAYSNFNYKGILKYEQPITVEQELIYLNAERLNQSKRQVKKNNPIYIDAYNSLIVAADEELEKGFNPVTNKTTIPPSGDMHDYYSLAPYSWPNPDTEDGLPWIGKDGQINPMARGTDTDFTRLRDMFTSLDTLTMAYYFSDDEKYINKAKDIISVWFIDEKTKMNPNINFGQGVPGYYDGRRSGIIEWVNIGIVVTTVQILEQTGILNEREQAVLNGWFSEYLKWLTTSEFGILADNAVNNHGSNYDYQVVGLMLYLNKVEEVKEKLESMKAKRIEHHISADGSQPLELARTKSVNYIVNNLWAITRTLDLGLRFTDIDLWAYESKEGINLKLGYDFVIPYILGKKEWKWQQITGGGAESQLQNWALPMFSRTELMLGQEILPREINAYSNFNYKDILRYTPYM